MPSAGCSLPSPGLNETFQYKFTGQKKSKYINAVNVQSESFVLQRRNITSFFPWKLSLEMLARFDSSRFKVSFSRSYKLSKWLY